MESMKLILISREELEYSLGKALIDFLQGDDSGIRELARFITFRGGEPVVSISEERKESRTMKARFNVGDRVRAVSFVDCFKKTVPEVTGLTVVGVRLIEDMSIDPYFRIRAENPGAKTYIVEGAERYFEKER